ncbi:MAG: pyrroline-5-carboxylate reductase [Crocinitomicaceae bacterium]|jgi:pyrroline-5-carboxylate reductase
MKIGIVGCGNLGLSILNGIIKESPDAQVYASKRNIDSIRSLASDTVKITTDNSELIKNSNIIILALKPYNILPFIKEHNELFKSSQHTIVSVATGIEIEHIKNEMIENVGVYRAMPNTATSVNESMTTIAGSEDVLNRSVEVSSIFETLGEVVVIEESLMDAATILGACGVAYVLRFMRAMIQGGIQVGFDAKTATKIVSQTMKGASELIIQNGTHPEEEIDKVTTPKGCTIVGLNEMEHAGFSSALIKGIVTSYEKIES